MNYRLTAILLALAALFGGIIWFFLFSGMILSIVNAPAKPEDTKPKITNPVFDPQPKNVTALTMKRNGAVVVAFAKDNDKWSLTQPIQARTDKYQLDDIADALKDLSFREKITPESSGHRSLAELGLSEPRTTVSFTDSDGKSFTLLVGKRSPRDTVYVRRDGDASNTVYEIDGGWYERLDKEPTEFRTKELVDINVGAVRQISIARPAENLKPIDLTQTGGKWAINAPIPARAAQQTVEDVLDQFRRLRAESFSSIKRDNPATELTTPRLQITVRIAGKPDTSAAEVANKALPEAIAKATKDNDWSNVNKLTTQATSLPATQPTYTEVTVDFGNYTDYSKRSVYASVAGSPEVVIVSAEAFKKLDKQLNDLRDPAITPAPVTEATSIDITHTARDSAYLLIRREGFAWKFQSLGQKDRIEQPLPADDATVNEFLDGLKSLRANKFVDAVGDRKSLGLEPPVTTVTLVLPKSGATGEKEVILIGNPQTAEPVKPVQRQGESTVYLVLTADMAKLNLDVLAVRTRTVDTFVADQIRSIDITAKGGGKTTLERAGTSWKVGGKPADESKVSSLLAQFTPLSAEKWTATTPLDPQAADIIVTLVCHEPAKTEPATASAPASGPALPGSAPMGPALTNAVTKRLLLAKQKNAWRATLESPTNTWTFEPSAALVEDLTKTTYTPAPATSTAPATATAPMGEP